MTERSKKILELLGNLALSTPADEALHFPTYPKRDSLPYNVEVYPGDLLELVDEVKRMDAGL